MKKISFANLLALTDIKLYIIIPGFIAVNLDLFKVGICRFLSEGKGGVHAVDDTVEGLAAARQLMNYQCCQVLAKLHGHLA